MILTFSSSNIKHIIKWGICIFFLILNCSSEIKKDLIVDAPVVQKIHETISAILLKGIEEKQLIDIYSIKDALINSNFSSTLNSEKIQQNVKLVELTYFNSRENRNIFNHVLYNGDEFKYHQDKKIFSNNRKNWKYLLEFSLDNEELSEYDFKAKGYWIINYNNSWFIDQVNYSKTIDPVNYLKSTKKLLISFPADEAESAKNEIKNRIVILYEILGIKIESRTDTDCNYIPTLKACNYFEVVHNYKRLIVQPIKYYFEFNGKVYKNYL